MTEKWYNTFVKGIANGIEILALGAVICYGTPFFLKGVNEAEAIDRKSKLEAIQWYTEYLERHGSDPNTPRNLNDISKLVEQIKK